MSLKRILVVTTTDQKICLYKTIRVFCDTIGIDYDTERKIISTECTQDGKCIYTYKSIKYTCKWYNILQKPTIKPNNKPRPKKKKVLVSTLLKETSIYDRLK